MSSDLFKAYKNRIDQLTVKLNAVSETNIKNLIIHSIVVTDISMQLITDELPSLFDEYRLYNNEQKKNFEELKKRTDMAKESAVEKNSRVGNLCDSDLTISDVCIKATESALLNIAELNQIEVRNFDNTIYILDKSLDNLLKSANLKDIEEAFKELVKILLGLTPVGPILSLIQTFQNIGTAHTAKEANANDTLNFYSAYIQSLYNWNVLAQSMVEHHKHIFQKNESKETENDLLLRVENIIQKRFDNRINNSTRGQVRAFKILCQLTKS